MTDLIRSVLEKEGISVWRMHIRRRSGTELFYIARRLDMRRTVDLTETGVTVFRDFEEDGKRMRGSARFGVHPGMTAEEIRAAAAGAYEAAGYVKNPWYELPDPVEDIRPETEYDTTAEQDAGAMADTLFGADHYGAAVINSCEIFSYRDETEILASNGLHVRFDGRTLKGEFVVQNIAGQDVEFYRDFRYDRPDTEALYAEAEQALAIVRDRAKAKEAPKAGIYDCVLSGRELSTLMRVYSEKADAAMVYAKYSQYAPGCALQGENVEGEKLELSLADGEPYSEEGIALRGMELAKEGRLLALQGPDRFCRYLGIEPAGRYGKLLCANGTVPFAELKKTPCIVPVSFSDFQADELSGRFAGEIRLAYVYDEEGMHTVTGGSVSGSLLEAQKDMAFSLERYACAEYEGPLAVRLKSVSVAGRE